uniref:HDC08330 n=1 Tax=Drosophila melanogaster TaxID=7227 RepID=Q6ILU1_DROME|nr:TPA_inf: HDC08330 [Drosophila melanogaster]
MFQCPDTCHSLHSAIAQSCRHYLRTAFDLLDRNRDGRVTANELQFMLKNLGINVSDELIHDLIREASHSGPTKGSWGTGTQALMPATSRRVLHTPVHATCLPTSGKPVSFVATHLSDSPQDPRPSSKPTDCTGRPQWPFVMPVVIGCLSSRVAYKPKGSVIEIEPSKKDAVTVEERLVAAQVNLPNCRIRNQRWLEVSKIIRRLCKT